MPFSYEGGREDSIWAGGFKTRPYDNGKWEVRGGRWDAGNDTPAPISIDRESRFSGIPGAGRGIGKGNYQIDVNS